MNNNMNIANNRVKTETGGTVGEHGEKGDKGATGKTVGIG